MEINIFLSKHLEVKEFLRFSNTLIPIRVPFPFGRTQSVSGLQLKTLEQGYNVDQSSFFWFRKIVFMNGAIIFEKTH